MSFRPGAIERLTLPIATGWLLADIGESKGRQQLFTRQAPQLLRALREAALVQSVESFNRIEGVTVAADRLRPLVIGGAKPQDRSEEDIRGYRDALALVHAHAADLSVTPETLRRLHGLAQRATGDAGEWKRVDNDIVELRAGAAPVVRFRPVRFAEAPAVVEELCLAYRDAVAQGRAPGLILEEERVMPAKEGKREGSAAWTGTRTR